MLDAVAEFLIRTVVVEVVFYRICYWPGWFILRVLTLGKYPPPKSMPHNRYFVAGIPLVVLLIAITFIAS